MNNYARAFQEEIASLPRRPRPLFHACCGVCCVYPLLLLDQYFEVTVFYANSNIYPLEEYDHRLAELERYLRMIIDHDISLIVPPRRSPSFLSKLAPYGDEKEGGRRCELCYGMRLEEAFAYAKEEGYDYCSTVMSISNRKDARILNELGAELSAAYGVRYLPADFKKNGGAALNEKLNRLVGLYHQTYCGCPFSMYNGVPGTPGAVKS